MLIAIASVFPALAKSKTNNSELYALMHGGVGTIRLYASLIPGNTAASGGSTKGGSFHLSSYVIPARYSPAAGNVGAASLRHGLPAIPLSIPEDICLPHINQATHDIAHHVMQECVGTEFKCNDVAVRVISIFVTLRTGDLAWHSAARNALKSCSPRSNCAADPHAIQHQVSDETNRFCAW